MTSEVVVPKPNDDAMAGIKRDHQGKEKKGQGQGQGTDIPRNAYTSMFESFRDELDEHHDRRQRIIKITRDVTALSKKIIFALQRVRKLSQPVPQNIRREIEGRVQEIAVHLAALQPDVQGLNRHRYNLSCLEEWVEAISFWHYLENQKLISASDLRLQLGADIELTCEDYAFGVFDLTGEMMRFATAVTALSGGMPSGGTGMDDDKDISDHKRTILNDLQDVSSMLQICPVVGRLYNYSKKMDVMVEQVRKVERVGYSVIVRYV